MAAKKASGKRVASTSEAPTPEPDLVHAGQVHVFLAPVDRSVPPERPLIAVLDAAGATAIGDVSRLLSGWWTDDRHRPTSIRLNESLKAAADIAVERGWAPSFTALVEEGLAVRLADVITSSTEQAALDEHYAAHPEVRPDLWEIAVAAARLDGSPLADHPALIRRAAEVLGEHADVDRVLLWAAGALDTVGAAG